MKCDKDWESSQQGISDSSSSPGCPFPGWWAGTPKVPVVHAWKFQTPCLRDFNAREPGDLSRRGGHFVPPPGLHGVAGRPFSFPLAGMKSDPLP